ncbi:MAG: Uncharacterised protein [Chloroflexota bacterium]|nr:MAG: Uncharacterised protein [Chloroflexota bacterium]
MLTCFPEGKVKSANPKSTVIARAFSSGNLSGSILVNAFTNEDLPWSTWPAVPNTNIAYILYKFFENTICNKNFRWR